MTELIKKQAAAACREICEKACLKRGQILVVGCSSSAIVGDRPGSNSNPEIGEAVLLGMAEVLEPKGIYLAAQCCEHLNRAVIIEREAVPGHEIVSVVPQPKAGGSFATAAYKHFKDPVALEEIAADSGIDVGGTLIGMHLKKVAIPVSLENDAIGKARLTAARTRPKFIGGVRARYDEALL